MGVRVHGEGPEINTECNSAAVRPYKGLICLLVSGYVAVSLQAYSLTCVCWHTLEESPRPPPPVPVRQGLPEPGAHVFSARMEASKC